MGRLARTKPHFRAIFAICDDFEAISKLDFEAILMEFDFRENFTGKLGTGHPRGGPAGRHVRGEGV